MKRALPLLLLAATRGWFWWRIPFANEDAYITFRYARSWVRGMGPVYNAGEHVLGTTSPLWMTWTALGMSVVRDPVLWTRLNTVGLETLVGMYAGVQPRSRTEAA